jgi:hypothetical protein
MRLQSFACQGAPVRALTVLKGMPLTTLTLTYSPQRGDAAVLDALPGLTTINGQPAAGFRQQFNAR